MLGAKFLLVDKIEGGDLAALTFGTFSASAASMCGR
jgi:hypothetical protein